MADLQSIVNTTMPKFFKGAEDETMRKRVLFKMLQDRGQIDYNASGRYMDWKVMFRDRRMQGSSPLDQVQYAIYNRHKTAQLPWRKYYIAEFVDEMEMMQNKGPEAIVNIVNEMGTNLLNDCEKTFGDHMYIDGNASGNTLLLHGLESCLSDSGSYVDGAGTTSPALVTNDTYAGLSTAQGNYAPGTWDTSTWPIGTGQSRYDFYSPLILNATAGSWSASTKTWPNTCEEVVRFAASYLGRNVNVRGRADLGVFEAEMFRQWKEKISAKEQVFVTMGQDQSRGRTGTGYGDEYQYEGFLMTSDYGVPANTGYLINLAHLRLVSLAPTIFIPMEPKFNENQFGMRYAVRFYGNLRITSPRSICKIKRS